MDTAVFLNQRRANVCGHTTKMASLEFFKGATRGVARGMDLGKFKRRLSEVNARPVSRGQNELVYKFNFQQVMLYHREFQNYIENPIFRINYFTMKLSQ